jgi:hypothetical protein
MSNELKVTRSASAFSTESLRGAVVRERRIGFWVHVWLGSSLKTHGEAE